MSASLPRIKTVHELGKNNPDSQKDLKVKFRRLTLDDKQPIQQRKKSIKSIKSSRLNSLQRYTTIQQQRQYKNEKIQLNLIERKLLNGTYDEKKQTGNELNNLKQKRDQMKVDMVSKQKQIERIKVLLDDVKQQTEIFLDKKGQHDEKLKQLKQKSDNQLLKAEYARQSKSVLENMIKARQDINIVLSKRHYNMKEQLTHLKSAQILIQTELRQITQKLATQQSKLQTLLKNSLRQRHQRNEQISKHQQKISKRKQGEIIQSQKSKKYIAHLDDVQRQTEIKQFHQIYDKILANIFISRYNKRKQTDLRQKYQKYEQSYNTLKTYKSFDISKPSTMVTRFFQHSSENQKLQAQIKMKQDLLASLEKEKNNKKKRLQIAQNEAQQIQQNFNLMHHAQKMTKQRQLIANTKKQAEELDEKNIRIKTYILRLLKDMNQKGDKRIYTGIQTTVNNLTLLSNVLKQSYKQIN